MNNNRSSCPKILLCRRRANGSLVLIVVPCEASRRCPSCAKQRARRLARALRLAAESSGLKLVFLTITFRPSLGVNMRNVNQWRHRIFETFRRRAISAGMPFDYISVIERHKSGRPHLHVVLAWLTVRSARDVARRAVKGSHCNARLVRDDAVTDYLSKYVVKQAASLTSSRDVARRASQSVARGLYELIAIKPPHMSVKDWLDSINVYWYDFEESWQE